MSTPEIKTVFDIINNICNSRTLLEPHQIEGVYNPYMVNKGMSYFQDTVFYAEEANRFPATVPVYAQYLFYFNMVPKRKRFAPWTKKQVASDAVKAIQEIFDVSMRVAMDYCGLATEEQLTEAIELVAHGGKAAKNAKKSKATAD